MTAGSLNAIDCGDRERLKVTGLQITGKYLASNYRDVKSQAGIIAATSVCTGLHKQKLNEAL